ncbi:MAG: transporter [Gammaproteobacteria bacterium]|nr:transporter [Gammaproteobacteria bacterium]
MIKRTISISIIALVLSVPALASGDDGQPNDILRKMEEVNAQYTELLDKMDSIERQRRQLELLMYQIDDLDQYRGGMNVEDAPPEAIEVATERKQELEAQTQAMPELPRVSNAVGGVLTPKGRLTIEPSMGFSYSSVNRIAVEGFTILPALLVGIIDVVEADRDSYTARLTGRYGITDRFEAELSVPWIYRDDATRSREFLTGAVEDKVFKAQGQGIGDVELGLRYQFRRSSPTAPFLVGNLRIKSDTGSDPFEIASMSTLAGQPQFSTELPTGSGFWSVNPSLTFIYPSDPVVFFGSIGYLWTIEDDKGTSVDDEGNILGFGRVDPGDAYRASFGLGLGLNENSSFSISYQLDQFTRTRIETAADPSIAGSDVTVGKLLIGYSLRMNDGPPLNLAVGIGTTDDAPDTDLTFRVPFNFGD